MANYCYGDMIVKGAKENVLIFLHKALIPVTATGKLLNIDPVKKINTGFIKIITRNDNNNYHNIKYIAIMYIIQYNSLNNQIKPLRGLIIFKKTYRKLSEEGLTNLAETGLNVEF